MMKFADTKPQRISGDAALKLLELECETVCINDTILFDKEICNYRVQRMSFFNETWAKTFCPQGTERRL